MGKLKYNEGDLFHQKGKNRVLVHSCNCKGVWGSGIAKEFKKHYPDAFESYEKVCKMYGKNLLGTYSASYEDENYTFGVVNLFTSDGYGQNRDSEKDILKHTARAIDFMLKVIPEHIEINSPKINSGKFRVSWEKTEAVIKECLKKTNHTWNIWEKPKADAKKKA